MRFYIKPYMYINNFHIFYKIHLLITFESDDHDLANKRSNRKKTHFEKRMKKNLRLDKKVNTWTNIKDERVQRDKTKWQKYEIFGLVFRVK